VEKRRPWRVLENFEKRCPHEWHMGEETVFSTAHAPRSLLSLPSALRRMTRVPVSSALADADGLAALLLIIVVFVDGVCIVIVIRVIRIGASKN
jgi:hypothetical protein